MKAPPSNESPVDVPAPTSPPPSIPSVASWPQWVKSVDATMAVIVLIAAFMVASHVARNSDQWLHFAGGRALLNGTYSLGTDPFSHVGEGRTWVNHSWLAGVAMVLLYNGDPTGFVIVAVKAFLVALTFGIVLLIRRSGQTLWPWVLATAIAVVAAAPQTGLRPFVLSGLFLAVTLFVLLGRDWKSGSRLNIATLGILFWVWASCDSWFILGPLAVAAVLLGEFVQKFLGRPGTEEERIATVGQLAAALAVGIVACSLTPHHVRVWQLPVELGFSLPANYQSDFETALISLSPLNEQYWKLAGRGWNANGLAFAALFAGGGLALALGYARVRAAHFLLWFAFAGLALFHVRLILPFAVVAVPVLGRALGGLVDRVPLGAADGPRAKMLLLLSGVGRIIALPFAIMFVAAAYPGWLHPPAGHPSMAQRCAWGVEPEPGLRRTAELLGRWRESGRLPDDYRGLVVNFDLANHIAWFAPKEKVFANSRFGFHLPELEELIKSRRIFLNRQPGEPIENVEIANFREFSQKFDVSYVVYSGMTLTPVRPVDLLPLYQLTSYAGGYALWHVDGRAVVLGDMRSRRARPETFAALAFDPVRQAFHPDLVTPLQQPPDGMPKRTVEPTVLDPFVLDLPKPPPLESLDATVWSDLATQTAESDFFLKTQAWPQLAGIVGNREPARLAQLATYRADDVTTAYRFLALRAAFRAIAENPSYPDPYFVVAQAGGFARGPQGEGAPASIPGLRTELKQQFEIAGLRQLLDRLPPPEKAGMGSATFGYFAALWLYELYQPPAATERGQVVLPDPATWALTLATRYYPRTESALRNPKEAEKVVKELEGRLKQLDALTAESYKQFEPYKRLEIHRQLPALIQLRLFTEAVTKFQEIWSNTDAMGPDPVGLTLAMSRVYMQLGQLDEADYHLREADAELERMAGDPASRQQWEALARFSASLRNELSQFRADCARAGEGIEQSILGLKMSEVELGFARHASSRKTLDDFGGYMNAPHLMAAVGGLGTMGQGEIQFSLKKWQAQSDAFLQRGLLLLLEGKIAEARFRFEQALKPEKIELPAYLTRRSIAEQYIRMIDRAAK